MIKLIQFSISGHALFEDNTTFSIAAVGQNNPATAQRVIDFGHGLSINRAIGVVGINATGKSTLFNLFAGLSAFYLNDQSIDQTELQQALRGRGPVVVDAFLASTQGIRYRVTTTFAQAIYNTAETSEFSPPGANSWLVADETIFKKKATVSTTKAAQFRFTADDIISQRSTLAENVQAMLSPQDSSFRAIRGKEPVSSVISLVKEVDTNSMITFADQTPSELLQYLDSSIEYLKYQRNAQRDLVNVQLKFRASEEVITAPKFEGITQYLSSGTVRGITLFFEMVRAFRTGATLLVDEIELHINKQIVNDFINFFHDHKINFANGTLVYSTHYLELIDDSERKDENYILSRQERTKVVRYSDIPGLRSEVKKSDVVKSNFIGGTAPNYDLLVALKRNLENSMGPNQADHVAEGRTPLE